MAADHYDVKVDAGATGNGSTDDTTAIQTALDAVKASGTRRLFFPAGTYKITGRLDMDGHQGTVLFGAGHATKLAWSGGSTGPLLYLAGSRENEIRDMRVGPTSSSFPIDTLIKQEQDGLPGSGVSTMNRYRRLQIDGLNVVTQLLYLKGATTDANNDFTSFDELYLSGYDEAAIVLEGANCLNNWITRCQMGGGRNGNYGVKSITGAGGQAAHFHLSQCGLLGHLQSDIYLQTRCAQPIVVDNLYSEGSERCFLTGSINGSASGIALRNIQWSSDQKAQTYDVVDIRMPGPVSIDGCLFGSDYSHAIRINWTYTGGYFAPSFAIRNTRIWGNLTSGFFPGTAPTVKSDSYYQTSDTTSGAL